MSDLSLLNMIRTSASGCGYFVLAALLAFGAVGASDAANISRQYDFEEGTPGSTTTSVEDAVTDLFFEDVPNNPTLDWLEVSGTAGRPLPGGQGLADAVAEAGLTAPALEAFAGNATFVDVTSGPFAVPTEAPGVPGFPGRLTGTPSTVALRFDGTSNFDDFNTAQGSRGVYIDTEDFNNNVNVGDATIFESFSILSQAWVYPESSAAGTRQTVYQMGVQHGAINITDDDVPVWEVTNGGFADITTDIPVAFDQWNHVAFFRGGGSGTFWVNGQVAGTGEGFFGTFTNIVSIGGAEFTENPFTGLIDNFLISGFGDLSLNAFDDLEFPVIIDPDPDLNQDGTVDEGDYQIWSDNVGFDNGLGDGDTVTFSQGDANLNGRTDFFDFTFVSGAARDAAGGATAGSVPEPGTLTVLVLLASTAAVSAGRRV